MREIRWNLLIKMRKAKLYTTVSGCAATVFLYKYIAGFCSREYDGYEDLLLWEFVKAALTSKQIFPDFHKIAQARYDRYLSPINFLTVNTLIDLWFA